MNLPHRKTRRRPAPLIHYLTLFNEGTDLGPHRGLDKMAQIELSAPFLRNGYEIGEQKLLFPRVGGGLAIEPVDLSFLKPGHLFLACTRFPLRDWEGGRHRKIGRSYTTLEEIAFDCIRRYFHVLERTHVRLQPEVVARMSAEHQNRGDMWVHVFKKCAWYREIKPLDATHAQTQKFRKSERRTPVFLLRLDGVAELNGADLLVAFGLSGPNTLVWARRLRTDLSELLERPGFTLAEMKPPPPVVEDDPGYPLQPFDLDYARDWQIDVIVQMGELSAPALQLARSPA